MQASIVAENVTNYLCSHDATAVNALAAAVGIDRDAAARGCEMLGGPAMVREATAEQLEKAFGIEAAERIASWRAFVGAVCSVPVGSHFHSSGDAVAYLRAQAELLTRERVWILCLNHKQRVLSTFVLSDGTETGAEFDIRTFTRAALASGAAGVVIVHNHPSGDTTPSREDIQVTKRAKAALTAVGITLLDHVIVSPTESSSMLDMGLI